MDGKNIIVPEGVKILLPDTSYHTESYADIIPIDNPEAFDGWVD